MTNELEKRFAHHAAGRTAQKRHEQINALTLELARRLERLAPASRELGEALTKLQEVRMWAHAAIACNQELLVDEPAGMVS